jgi:hypothetical protein
VKEVLEIGLNIINLFFNKLFVKVYFTRDEILDFSLFFALSFLP